MKTIGIIPARYASTRFPGKPLEMLEGKSMIQRVYEQTLKARRIDEAIVATDDKRIFEHVRHFGGLVSMTSASHRSGTDRCAEVAARIDEADIIVNVQGDEPFIDPEQIDKVVEPIARRSEIQISTLAKKITSVEALQNPNVVKLVMNRVQEAMYFSRSAIPYVRGLAPEQWLANGVFYKHIGLYGFRAEALQEISKLEPSPYEQLESLEQLRWLDAGFRIFVNITELETIGIDTPEDLERAKKELRK
jgi:3-deoxy-manno-octulosonate cytidylyltransferase (CMP-KDO synthetase)